MHANSTIRHYDYCQALQTRVTLIYLLQMVQAPSTARMAYIVDPRKEHNPAVLAAQPDPPTKGAPKGGKAAAAAAAGPPADLVGAFQQGVLQQWGKEWTGVAGSGQSCAGVALHALGKRGTGGAGWSVHACRSSRGLQSSRTGIVTKTTVAQVPVQTQRLAVLRMPETGHTCRHMLAPACSLCRRCRAAAGADGSPWPAVLRHGRLPELRLR